MFDESRVEEIIETPAGGDVVSASAARDSFYRFIDRSHQNDCYFILDEDLKIVNVGEELQRQLGYDKNMLTNRHIAEIIRNKDSQFIDKCRALFEKKSSVNFSDFLYDSKDTEIEYLINLTSLFINENYKAVVVHLSQKKKDSSDFEVIKEGFQYHQLMVQNLPLGLIVLSAEGKIVTSNSAFSTITGFTQDDILNRSVSAIDFLADIRYRYLVDNLLRYNVNFDMETDSITMKNENQVYLRFRGYHLKLQNDVSYYLLVFGNITRRKHNELLAVKKLEELKILEIQHKEQIASKESELKEKEWQLLEKNRIDSSNALLSKISHYWRQPLNNATVLIQSIADDYEYGELDSNKFYSKLNKAVNQLVELSQTLETFRYFSNDDSNVSDFDIRDNILRSIELIKPNYQNNKAIINLDLEYKLSCNGYPRRFSQAIVNIIDNAMLAFEERNIARPYLYIKLACNGDRTAKLVIGDNAGGIDADIATRIFDAYFTTRSDTAKGLGLYQASRVICDMFSGSIDYKKTNIGSEFILLFPSKKL